MRVPIGCDLESRDGGVTKDARIANAFLEQKGPELWILKRPGMSDLGSIRSGTAQMLGYFNSQVISVLAGNVDRSTLPMSSTSVGSIEDASGIAITRSGSTATVTHGWHGYETGDSITIAGATQPEYNGTFTITVTTISNYTYTVSGTPATPATGTITDTTNNRRLWRSAENGLSVIATGYCLMAKNYSVWRLTDAWNLLKVSDSDLPCNSTPRIALAVGVVYMDGYFFLMDAAGRIWSSNLDADPVSAWTATGVVSAEKQAGAGIAIDRTLDYIVAFKEYTTELFYNAANPTDSPLSPVDNGYFEIGCASGYSVAHLSGSVFWIGRGREKGRGVYKMRGLDNTKISTPDIDRIINGDSLGSGAVFAYGLNISGHACYVLTLTGSNITLVYDDTVGKWTTWSSYTLNGSSSTVSSITRSGTTATVTTSAAHGLADGDPVKIAGADQAGYNGIFQIRYLTTTTFTIEVTGSPTTPATGSITATGYTESYFKFTQYVNAGGRDVFLHASDGHAYEMLTSLYQDNAIPINVFGRSIRLDGGSYDTKKMGNLALVGDKVSDTVMVRWSDDDSGSFTAYRNVDMSKPEPRLRRCGSFKRRSLEFRHTGNNPLRLAAFDLGVTT